MYNGIYSKRGTAMNITIDEGTHEIFIMGRIGNVRWLEQEYGATRERHSVKRYNEWKDYTRYVVEVAADSEQEQNLISRLVEAEQDSGIWFEVQPKVTATR